MSHTLVDSFEKFEEVLLSSDKAPIVLEEVFQEFTLVNYGFIKISESLFFKVYTGFIIMFNIHSSMDKYVKVHSIYKLKNSMNVYELLTDKNFDYTMCLNFFSKLLSGDFNLDTVNNFLLEDETIPVKTSFLNAVETFTYFHRNSQFNSYHVKTFLKYKEHETIKNSYPNAILNKSKTDDFFFSQLCFIKNGNYSFEISNGISIIKNRDLKEVIPKFSELSIDNYSHFLSLLNDDEKTLLAILLV